MTYEQTVSELLDWVMTEAENFAKEVTTRGDKGVVDHIDSCEVGTLIRFANLYIYAYLCYLVVLLGTVC